MMSMLLAVLITGCQKDDEPAIHPAVSSSDPANNATNVALNSTISSTFNVAMDPSTITTATFTLKAGSTSVTGTTLYAGKTASFTPSALLVSNTVYTATITMGAKNLAGQSMASNKVITFTTVDNSDLVVPTISSTNPGNNATGVARNKVVSLNFSEAMNASTITNSTFIVMQGATTISGTVAYSGTTATFTSSSAFASNTEYTATVTTGVKDLAGNILAVNKVWTFTTGGSTSTLGIVDLGTSGSYVIMAKSAINNSSTSAITGDLALSPAATSYITGLTLTDATGYATSAQITGKVYAADMAVPTPINLTTAVGDMITAYNDAAGRPSPDFEELGTGNIGGKTLLPGLYKWTSTVTMPSDVAISGGANDVWIFQISGDLSMSSAVNITLSGGAQAKNIFWQVAGQATLGTTSHFEGIILSKTGITFQTGASVNGRLLAQTAVILDSNAVVNPN
jgi:methionine-rich copper-binding protein CopC